MAEASVTSSTTTLWFKLGVQSDEAKGYFPASWLNEGLDQQDAVLVRLDPQEQCHWSNASSPALLSLRSRKNWFLFLSLQDNYAIGTLPEINSYACPLSLAGFYMKSAGARNDEIPYVDTVLPRSIDIHGHTMRSFILNHVRPRPRIEVLDIRDLGLKTITVGDQE